MASLVYWDPIAWDSKFSDRVHKTKDEQRKKFGWVEAEREYEEVPIPWTEISNRYFEIHHKQL